MVRDFRYGQGSRGEHLGLGISRLAFLQGLGLGCGKCGRGIRARDWRTRPGGPRDPCLPGIIS